MNTATKYVDAAEIAKLVRRDLKAAFPKTKFSVRTDKYAGGASVRVGWHDGPVAERIERIARRYEGASFDAMQDLKTHKTAEIAGESVHSMADFVFCSRRVSNEEPLRIEAEAIIRARCVTEGAPPNDLFGQHWVRDLARAMVYTLDFPEHGVYAEQWDTVFRVAVLREPVEDPVA